MQARLHIHAHTHTLAHTHNGCIHTCAHVCPARTKPRPRHHHHARLPEGHRGHRRRDARRHSLLDRPAQRDKVPPLPLDCQVMDADLVMDNCASLLSSWPSLCRAALSPLCARQSTAPPPPLRPPCSNIGMSTPRLAWTSPAPSECDASACLLEAISGWGGRPGVLLLVGGWGGGGIGVGHVLGRMPMCVVGMVMRRIRSKQSWRMLKSNEALAPEGFIPLWRQLLVGLRHAPSLIRLQHG